MGVCKCVCVWIWSGLLIKYGRVQVCVRVDLVWVADNVWESASVCVCVDWSGLLITYERVYVCVCVCVCVDLVSVADNVWESASVCVFGLG